MAPADMDVGEDEGQPQQQHHGGNPKGGSGKLQPWVEKYRPKNVDEVAYQEEVILTLKKAIETGVMPHLLFYGPPGTGKTSTILAVARTLFGAEVYKKRILELNASDERGIKVVREKIKTFAQLAVGGGGRQTNGKPSPHFKLIILDEADTMTPEAQAALRRTMETHSKVTRFCLICNYVTRIIEPLASRCAKFRFRSLNQESMLTRLNTIVLAESIRVQPPVLEAIVGLSAGDMRRAVMMLQSGHMLNGGNSETELSLETVEDVAGKLPEDLMKRLWAVMRTTKYKDLEAAVEEIICEGFPLQGLLLRLQQDVLCDTSMGDGSKARICVQLARADKALIDGGSETLQLLNTAGLIMRELNGIELTV